MEGFKMGVPTLKSSRSTHGTTISRRKCVQYTDRLYSQLWILGHIASYRNLKFEEVGVLRIAFSPFSALKHLQQKNLLLRISKIALKFIRSQPNSTDSQTASDLTLVPPISAILHRNLDHIHSNLRETCWAGKTRSPREIQACCGLLRHQSGFR